jgi:hypothetical protein
MPRTSTVSNRLSKAASIFARSSPSRVRVAAVLLRSEAVRLDALDEVLALVAALLDLVENVSLEGTRKQLGRTRPIALRSALAREHA